MGIQDYILGGISGITLASTIYYQNIESQKAIKKYNEFVPYIYSPTLKQLLAILVVLVVIALLSFFVEKNLNYVLSILGGYIIILGIVYIIIKIYD